MERVGIDFDFGDGISHGGGAGVGMGVGANVVNAFKHTVSFAIWLVRSSHEVPFSLI